MKMARRTLHPCVLILVVAKGMFGNSLTRVNMAILQSITHMIMMWLYRFVHVPVLHAYVYRQIYTFMNVGIGVYVCIDICVRSNAQ